MGAVAALFGPDWPHDDVGTDPTFRFFTIVAVFQRWCKASFIFCSIESIAIHLIPVLMAVTDCNVIPIVGITCASFGVLSQSFYVFYGPRLVPESFTTLLIEGNRDPATLLAFVAIVLATSLVGLLCTTL